MKIALIGYGKMGQELQKQALDRGHEVVCVIDLDNQDDFESEAFRSADVAIEFTNPASAFQNCKRALRAGVKVVSGSTGWMNEHEAEMKALCDIEGRTFFWSSNFSLGVAVFTAVNRYLAKIMNSFDSYEVSLSETHHVHKLDAPSGTAITLAQDIVNRLDRKEKWVKGTMKASDGTISGSSSHEPEEVAINSIREGEVPGIHIVNYESDADDITLIHDAKNRRGFALGAILAAEYAATHSGFLQMSDLFPFLND